jgi:Tfp pilus assembly protein PilO
MRRNFDFKAILESVRGMDLREPGTLMGVGAGVLLVLNLVAAAFAFHLFGSSPAEVAQQLQSTRQELSAARARLALTRQVAGKVQKARGEGDEFLTLYMTPRRTTYSQVYAEIQDAAEKSGMKWKEGTFSPPDPVKGSDDLSMITLSVSFEGPYPNLLKFVNLLDRSKRFLIMESLVAAPLPDGKTLSTMVKINTFVRDDGGGAL